MPISNISLTNFRSYETGVFELDPELTIVAGPNASGKTNLLESLYVLALTKSFRAKDRELIRHGQDHFRLVVVDEHAEYALGLTTVGGSLMKKVTHDKAVKTLAGHLGRLPVTLFEPADLALVSGPPEGRRRYLDFMLMQTDPRFVKTLQAYRRVLKQRNALLDTRDLRVIRPQIFAWDMQLTELAITVYEQRVKLLDALNSAVPGVYGDIAGSTIDITFVYVPSIDGDYNQNFANALTHNLPRDVAAGFTTIGPHREDFSIRFEGREITEVASRGEVRTAVLAMKMAELGFIEGVTGVPSLLLLDDVFSELDQNRRSFLTQRLGGHQTIITTTDAEVVTREFSGSHRVIKTSLLQARGAHARR